VLIHNKNNHFTKGRDYSLPFVISATDAGIFLPDGIFTAMQQYYSI